MSSEFKCLARGLLVTSTLIHSFLIPTPYVHYGPHCVCGGGGGWRHIIEEGLYGSAGGSERRAPVLQRMTLVVSALAPSVYATLT